MPADLAAAAIVVALALSGGAALACYQLLPHPPRYYYSTFAISDRWDCGRKATEIVCRNTQNETEAKQAIINLAAKLTGEQDRFSA